MNAPISAVRQIVTPPTQRCTGTAGKLSPKSFNIVIRPSVVSGFGLWNNVVSWKGTKERQGKAKSTETPNSAKSGPAQLLQHLSFIHWEKWWKTPLLAKQVSFYIVAQVWCVWRHRWSFPDIPGGWRGQFLHSQTCEFVFDILTSTSTQN